MKKITLLYVAVLFASLPVNASTLKIRNITESGVTTIPQATSPEKFGTPSATQVNMYRADAASALRQLYFGVDITVLNDAGLPVNAEWQLSRVAFRLYKDSTPLREIDLSRFAEPGENRSPYAVVYNTAGVKTTAEFAPILASETFGSRFVIGELTLSLGANPPKQPLMSLSLGSNYMAGFIIQGAYRAQGETSFKSFQILPGDASNNNEIYYNYGAVVITPGDTVPSAESWTIQLDTFGIENAENLFSFSVQDSSKWGLIPGGYDIERQTSPDLNSWGAITPGSVQYQGNYLWKIKNELTPGQKRGFFRIKAVRVPFIYVSP